MKHRDLRDTFEKTYSEQLKSNKLCKIPGIKAGMCSAKAPGSTPISSVKIKKQPCLVLTLFSFISL